MSSLPGEVSAEHAHIPQFVSSITNLDDSEVSFLIVGSTVLGALTGVVGGMFWYGEQSQFAAYNADDGTLRETRDDLSSAQASLNKTNNPKMVHSLQHEVQADQAKLMTTATHQQQVPSPITGELSIFFGTTGGFLLGTIATIVSAKRYVHKKKSLAQSSNN